MTKKEFIIAHKNYEEGQIDAWIHIRNLCNSCIKAHRENLKAKRLNEIADMNSNVWIEKEGKP